MCGIVGYVGRKDAVDILTKGLKRLEYRGYDSAGIAVFNDAGEILFRKKKGKVNELTQVLEKEPLAGTIGISHTRWSTHGVPNDVNAHPHLDCKSEIAVVHNGIIENFQELKDSLIIEGHNFASDTDTEVIAHLVEKFYEGNLEEAVRKAVKELRGSYAICVMHKNEPDRIIGARLDSPLIIGVGKDENFLASDIPAILEYTRDIVYVKNGEIVNIDVENVTVKNLDGARIEKAPERIEWDIGQAEKGGFSHFMLKEIFEQPEVIKKIINTRISDDSIHFDELKIDEDELVKARNIAIVACGTAYHAGLTGKYMLEEYTRTPVWADTSSEFRYRDPIVNKDTLVIVISQSGETADTLAALREARKRNAKVLAICNVLGSSIARESDGVIFTHAGPEIAVASTKAYTAQLATLYLFTLYMAKLKCSLSEEKIKELLNEFKNIPSLLSETLSRYEVEGNEIAHYARDFKAYYEKSHTKSFFLYLARNINYPNALEGALKLKEISYISAEGYPAGEMKHGPIALIDENPWVICIATKSRTYEKMRSNIQEVKARGGIVVAIITTGDESIKSLKLNYIIDIPEIHEFFSPILIAIPLQLLAYYVAREFGYDIDQPRNLAKSVTVE
ncbi:MAG: glutamine--fructose-6-phosphate transaminase (isomerizing) [Candidatus Omnitrophica bacterium]|nr:glutamine--fructose-6-phosphate transaminase (isomerizing) [Candidatus Omnitrophota bacterium]